jgi:hypothetical protein
MTQSLQNAKAAQHKKDIKRSLKSHHFSYLLVPFASVDSVRLLYEGSSMLP